jgi:hypothetical protein
MSLPPVQAISGTKQGVQAISKAHREGRYWDAGELGLEGLQLEVGRAEVVALVGGRRLNWNGLG